MLSSVTVHPRHYPVTHIYQSTNNNCSQTALAMMLSYYGKSMTAEDIMSQVAVGVDDNGEPWGTINQQLATWCVGQGFNVTMYTFDCQVIDLSWQGLEKTRLLERLDAAMASRVVPALGEKWSKTYLQSYMNYVSAGGTLHIKPYVTSTLLYDLLQDGPILAAVCFNTMYNAGRSNNVALRTSELDDVHGKVGNHCIVIYGVTENNEFEIADPWCEPGRHVVEPDRMICAITAAQIECDNALFQISSPRVRS